jgi:ATP-dependent DNA helicase PIF1
MKDELSPEQNYAFEKFKKGENIFLTGPGGSGKSKLIQHIIDYAKKAQNSYQVCALTGCAAVLLKCGGKTIHSWSGIKLARGDRDKIIANIIKNNRLLKSWRKIKILVIDEVSMMSEKIFELLDEIAKLTRNSKAFYGGIQLIFSGDFFQLPPVGTMGEPDTERFCFESKLWNQIFPLDNHIELEKIFRQTDPTYIKILSQVRRGELDEESIQILKTYVNRQYDATKYDGILPTKLYPIRAKVDYVNSTMFEKIDEIEYQLECSIRTDCKTIIENGKGLTTEEILKCNKMTMKEKEYEIDSMLNNTPCVRLLSLKKGASVLCTVNIDIENGICNGSQGKVVDIIDNDNKLSVIVKFTNGMTKVIEPYYWQSDEYPCIAIGQYPLCLAWALTIHKIQGATLSMAEMDIGKSVFEYGQTYVALSRVQSLEGLYLSAFEPHRVRANPKVVEFYKKIPKVDYKNIVLNPFSEFELKEEVYLEKDKNIKIIKL